MSPSAPCPGGRSWAAHAGETLSRAGHRSGAARAVVVQMLDASACCLSAQEVVDRSRAAQHPIGVASAYRVLEQLHSLHLVRRIDLGDGLARYEALSPDGERHHHVVCVECGRVVPFEDHRLESALSAASAPPGFSLIEHDVVLRGRCAHCSRDLLLPPAQAVSPA